MKSVCLAHHTLAIDVGNSRVKYGLFVQASDVLLPRCLHFFATDVDQAFPWPLLHGWVAECDDPPESRIAGANPRVVENLLSEWPHEWAAGAVVQSANDCGIECRVPEPQKVGIDRILNAVGANAIREPLSAAIVVDSGTATTVDSISVDGAFLGGAILPGFRLSSLALNKYTALLPRVSTRDLGKQSIAAIGQNTLEAIRSGLKWGQLGAVKELVARQALELGAYDSTAVQVFVTGGGGPQLSPHLENSVHLPYLPMLGLILNSGR